MKKLNKYAICAAVGLALCLVPMLAQATAHPFTSRMLTGTYLCLSNNTVATGDTNFYYYSYASGTNVLAGATNSAGITIPSPIGGANIVPDYNSDVNPNLAVQLVIGLTNNLLLSGVQSPVMLNTVWTNPAPYWGSVSGATNKITVTLKPVASADLGLVDTGTTKSFSFTTWYTNGASLILTTNLPTSFLQGAQQMQPTISVTGSNAVIFNALNLTGFAP